MSTTWLDQPDNPGEGTYDLTSDDIYGAVTAVNLADLTQRAALTHNFDAYQPVTNIDQLCDLTWLETRNPDQTLPVPRAEPIHPSARPPR